MFVRPKMGYVRAKIGLTGASREIICSPVEIAGSAKSDCHDSLTRAKNRLNTK